MYDDCDTGFDEIAFNPSYAAPQLTESQYTQLCRACDRLLVGRNSSVERVAIPWLHVIRENKTFISRYAACYADPQALHLHRLIKTARRQFGLILRVLRSIRISLRSRGGWPRRQRADVIFVSHIVSSGQAGRPDDPYFGDLPSMLAERGYSVLVAFINHTRESNEDLLRRWGPTEVPRIGLQLTAGFTEEMRHRRLLKRNAAALRKAASPTDGLDARVAILAADEALSPATLEVLALGKHVGRIVAESGASAIIATYEGHAWERVVWHEARHAAPGIRCLAYQHATITRLQHSVRRRLGKLFDPDEILTAGEAGAAELRHAPDLTSIPTRVIGSNRGMASTMTPATTTSGQNAKRCLVLPEGYEHETRLLVEFAVACARRWPDLEFAIRLHPMMSVKMLARAGTDVRSMPSNVSFSSGSLAADAAASGWVLYRGTTAVIQAVSMGARPVYLHLDGEMTIDPLHRVQHGRDIVQTLEEFRRLVLQGPRPVTEELLQHCESLFTAYEPSVLVDAIGGSLK
jgi:hypothetical protein